MVAAGESSLHVQAAKPENIACTTPELVCAVRHILKAVYLCWPDYNMHHTEKMAKRQSLLSSLKRLLAPTCPAYLLCVQQLGVNLRREERSSAHNSAMLLCGMYLCIVKKKKRGPFAVSSKTDLSSSLHLQEQGLYLRSRRLVETRRFFVAFFLEAKLCCLFSQNYQPVCQLLLGRPATSSQI